jgi:D-galactarolactone cycloisomerase
MANAFGVRVSPHVWGTGVALAAALQPIATLPDNPPSLNPSLLVEFDQFEPFTDTGSPADQRAF